MIHRSAIAGTRLFAIALAAAPTQEVYVNSIRILDAWVSAGVEPGALDAGTLGSHPSCETPGHGTDPLACSDEVFGAGF